MYNFLCHYSYHAYFTLLHKSEKSVTERNKRLSLWSLFINWGIQPVLDSYWLFIKQRGGFDWFLQPTVLPRRSKIPDPPKVSKNNPVGSILSCSKTAKWPVWKSIYLQSRTSYKHQIWTVDKPHLKGSIGSPPQEILMPLPHIHVTSINLFVSSHRGYCYQIWAAKTTPS